MDTLADDLNCDWKEEFFDAGWRGDPNGDTLIEPRCTVRREGSFVTVTLREGELK
jgi:hypothetical protein